MKTILFATTNPAKLDRFKRFIKGVDINVKFLKDLGYVILEPEEVGDTPVEIAMNKAKHYYDHLKEKIPVVAQDDTMEYIGIPELRGKQLSIKGPVIEKYGIFTPENSVKYYTELAHKYGGSINIKYNYGFGLCFNNLFKGESAHLDCVLVDKKNNITVDGYPMAAIVKKEVDGKQYYSSEMTENQHIKADHNLIQAVKTLLTYLD